MADAEKSTAKKPNLEEFPLAKISRWRYPKGDAGGVLFLYPPQNPPVNGFITTFRHRFESVHPEDYLDDAREGAAVLCRYEVSR